MVKLRSDLSIHQQLIQCNLSRRVWCTPINLGHVICRLMKVGMVLVCNSGDANSFSVSNRKHPKQSKASQAIESISELVLHAMLLFWLRAIVIQISGIPGQWQNHCAKLAGCVIVRLRHVSPMSHRNMGP